MLDYIKNTPSVLKNFEKKEEEKTEEIIDFIDNNQIYSDADTKKS